MPDDTLTIRRSETTPISVTYKAPLGTTISISQATFSMVQKDSQRLIFANRPYTIILYPIPSTSVTYFNYRPADDLLVNDEVYTLTAKLPYTRSDGVAGVKEWAIDITVVGDYE